MPKFAVEYGKDGLPPPSEDGRLDAPAYHRNQGPIWDVIGSFLHEKTGHVLEIGSGTGQHAANYALKSPDLTWWPSDIAATHLASIESWRRHAALPNLRPPQAIDLMNADWRWDGDSPDAMLTAILCINVLHISPWRVAENLLAGAGRLLDSGGYLFLYGPYKRGGAHTAASNAEFDASLRARNPEWGVRDLEAVVALAQVSGLSLARAAEMPANNLVLCFEHR
jgi:SAM-dependent methyltransferase